EQHHVELRQLIEDFASYLYLPRLLRPDVLIRAASDGVGLLTWQSDGFAYAEGYDAQARRYRGLYTGQKVALSVDSPGMLVKPEVALPQIEAEAQAARSTGPTVPSPPIPSLVVAEETAGGYTAASAEGVSPVLPASNRPRRFHGSVRLDVTRAGFHASQIADEVIAYLAAQAGAEVIVTLEISATLPEGASEHLVRTVMENSRALRFSSCDFEPE
ncbi:MAG: AAA+ family ATPase, partial [Chloroherpetonaceae bacterium]|nr:AAA+ family ATPase [Chloroherpetonaceae bacterium]